MADRRIRSDYRRLFENHPQPMWMFDPDSLRFIAVNEAAVATYGYSREEFLAMTIADIRPAEDHSALEHALRDLERRYVYAGVWRHRKKDGSVIDVKITSNRIEFEGKDARLVLAEDVTAQSRLEERMREAEKMEAIGKLASGIAHDFNNILLVIRGHSSSLLSELGEGKLRESVKQIDCAAARAGEFTHQLLTFSRNQVGLPEPVDLNALVAEMIQMLGHMLGEDIDVRSQLAPDVAPIVVDRGDLVRAILNLVVNAREAMPDGGTLTIGTANVELDAGEHVLLQVADSGVGMDAATQADAFEPFFTTKERGTGLGLATVFGVVKQSNGSISVESEPQAGTTFKLYFPRSTEAAAPVAASPKAGPLEGDETILLVEDMDAVRSLVTTTLESYGYTVLAAAGGAEALQLAEQHRGLIDVLLTDVIMPGMAGPVLSAKILALDPHVRVLFTSGSPADTIIRNGSAEVRAEFIEKPYLPAELARKLRDILA
jgi:two-component system cell cycle sensor histidine kinase/response regulator CckA